MTKQHGGARKGAGRRYLNGSDPHKGSPALQVSITVTADTLEQARERGDGNVSEGFRRAIEIAKEAGQMDTNVDTNDRIEQINWIHRTGADIADYSFGGTAEELVAWTLDHPDFVLPVWFDDHDRKLLVEWVDGSL